MVAKGSGARTFALTTLLGTLTSLISLQFALGGLGDLALLIILVTDARSCGSRILKSPGPYRWW